MRLNLVCDVSGSMSESGKQFQMRTAVMAVAQWVQFGYGGEEVHLCSWGSDARDFPHWSGKDEFPAELLSCNGTANGEALVKFLGEKANGKVMLFTDGFWTRGTEKLLRQWRGSQTPDTVRIVTIGADANPHLRGPDVFKAEEFFAFLDDWFGSRST